MFKKLNFFFYLFILCVNAQSFPPQVGFNGSTAIHKDNSMFVDWASTATITRGLRNIANPQGGFASFGDPINATGLATGNQTIVSLGDNGEAILSFNQPITNGQGFDFAVFENGFLESETSELAFLELAFVEVSTDGIEYVRFPATSELSTTNQITSFGYINARYINNFAGKYINNYGTPFNLDDLTDLISGTTVNLNQINYVKIIDVIGTLDQNYATYDYLNNAVNDPYPSEFISGGFDLDGVGVINNTTASINENILNKLKVYPNPSANFLHVKMLGFTIKTIEILSIDGKSLLKKINQNTINISNLETGIYLLKIKINSKIIYKKFVKITQ